MPFSVPYTFVPFTTIYSAQVNSNFSHLVNDGNTHEVATTGVHGVGVGQIVGTALTQTLTNKTINGGALTGTFTGTPAYSGRPIFSVGLTVPTTQTISLNVGATSRITESSADTIQIITGGTLGLQIDGSNVVLGNRALAIQSAQKFYLDGGSDTYLTEDAANEIQIVTNGANALRINHTSTGNINVQGRALTIDSGQRFYLDGGGDTYIDEVSANLLEVIVGGSPSVRFDSSGILLDTPDRLWLDYAKTSSIYQTGGTIRLSPSSGIVFCNAFLQLTDAIFTSSVTTACARSFAKAWAFVTASTATINLAFNIASVTRTSAGSFSVVFTTSFSNANYSIGMFAESASRVQINSRTTSGFDLVTFNSAGTALDFDFNFQIFGT